MAINRSQLRKDITPGDYVRSDDLRTIAAVSGQQHANYLRWAGMVNRLQNDRHVLITAPAGRKTPEERLQIIYMALAKYPKLDLPRWA